jgi:hypothetical protein
MATAKRKGRYSERLITNIRELKTLVLGLDLDEGIRFVADIEGYEKGAFVFLTKCGEELCVSIKERVLDKSSRAYVPGAREEWKYFKTPEEAWAFIVKLVKEPIRAYYY